MIVLGSNVDMQIDVSENLNGWTCENGNNLEFLLEL
jgi:hypothetical protein